MKIHKTLNTIIVLSFLIMLVSFIIVISYELSRNISKDVKNISTNATLINCSNIFKVGKYYYCNIDDINISGGL